MRLFLFVLLSAVLVPVIAGRSGAEAGDRTKIRFASVYVSLDTFRVAPGKSFEITAQVETTPKSTAVSCTPYVFLPARLAKLTPRATRGAQNLTWRFTVPAGTWTTFVGS